MARGREAQEGPEMQTTKIETIGAAMMMQTIVPTWMQKIADEVGDDGRVEVTRQHTPFGTFVVAIRPVSEVTA
jgi:hypothetical protein